MIPVIKLNPPICRSTVILGRRMGYSFDANPAPGIPAAFRPRPELASAGRLVFSADNSRG
jgi:hypothetical protein